MNYRKPLSRVILILKGKLDDHYMALVIMVWMMKRRLVDGYRSLSISFDHEVR